MKYFISIIALLLMLSSSSCKKKDDKCGYDVVFDVPAEFPEGEDLVIEIKNLAKKPFNTNYFFYPVDDKGLSVDNGSVTFQQKAGDELYSYKVENFDINDVGNYGLTIATGHDHCNSYTIIKHCALKPEVAPCGSLFKKNVLFVSESLGGATLKVECLPIFQPNADEFKIFVTDSVYSPIELILEFDTAVPEYSATYSGLNGHNANVNDFDFDSRLFCNIRLNITGYPTGYFKLQNFDHKVYLERSTNKMTLTLCEALFIGNFSDRRYVSAVIEIPL